MSELRRWAGPGSCSGQSEAVTSGPAGGGGGAAGALVAEQERQEEQSGSRLQLFTCRPRQDRTRTRTRTRTQTRPDQDQDPLPPPALRTPSLMSASVPSPSPCGRLSLVCGLLLLASSPLLTAGRLSNCSHPLVPEHGGFRCDPSPCRGFPQRSSIQVFCEPGFLLSGAQASRCRRGRWLPPIPSCIPATDSPNMSPDGASMPSMTTTAVGVSIFLLTTTACLVLKSRLCPCQSHSSRRSSDQLDLVGGLPVALPSYEEAVYGSWGQRLPALAAPGPTPLLLSQDAAGRADGCRRPLLAGTDSPPPYEEEPAPRAGEEGGGKDG